jgi:hypothetical protein
MDNSSTANTTLSKSQKLVVEDLAPVESALQRLLFAAIKYVFIFLNVAALAVSIWCLFGPNDPVVWQYSNSLLILGLMFGIVLTFVALYGAIKEECYLILTYNLFVTPIYVLAYVYHWRPLAQLIALAFYLVLCYLLAFLVYRKQPPIIALPIT